MGAFKQLEIEIHNVFDMDSDKLIELLGECPACEKKVAIVGLALVTPYVEAPSFQTYKIKVTCQNPRCLNNNMSWYVDRPSSFVGCATCEKDARRRPMKAIMLLQNLCDECKARTVTRWAIPRYEFETDDDYEEALRDFTKSML